MKDGEYKTVARYTDAVSAHIAEGMLLENGIPGLLLMGTFLGKMVGASFRLVLTSKEKREVVIVPFILSILLLYVLQKFVHSQMLQIISLKLIVKLLEYHVILFLFIENLL